MIVMEGPLSNPYRETSLKANKLSHLIKVQLKLIEVQSVPWLEMMLEALL